MRDGPGTWRTVTAAAGAMAVVISGCDRAPEAGMPIAAQVTFGGLGDTPGRFGYPRAIDGSTDGKSLWVIDKTARVQKIDAATGKALASWRMPDSEVGKPVGFCVAPGPGADGTWRDELLYIADTHYARVMVYEPGDERPRLVGRFGSYGQGDGQFIYPTDVAVLLGPDGRSVERIYVGEYGGNDRISVFDGGYRFLFSFGAWGDGRDTREVKFARPQSLLIMDVDGKKELVVADSANHRLGRFTLEGQLIGWIGTPDRTGDGPGEFRFPYGLAGVGDGTVMVSEFGGNRVQRIDVASGRSLGSWGRAGRGEGELAAPWAVAVLGRRTFVVDSGNNR
ncbi:MAG: hypothetical protein ACK4WH_07700, partial [Phycisphaerales bacterium]